MNPLSDKQLEKMLRNAPTGGDLDRAVQGVLARAERDGLVDVAYAPVDSPSRRRQAGSAEAPRKPAERG
jgi:hypothetical protein